MDVHRLVVFLNAGAGSVGDESISAIAEAFEEVAPTVEVRIVEVDPADLQERLCAEWDASPRPDALVVAGGDGTVNNAANAAAGTDVVLGVLPLGTFNHFACDLGMPGDLHGAVRALVGGEVRQVDVAEVNGRVFVNNSAVGVYPKMVKVRDAVMERRGWGKVRAVPAAVAHVLRRFPTHRLDLRGSGGFRRHDVRTPMLFVGNGRFEGRLGSPPERASLVDGMLDVRVTHGGTRRRLVWSALRALVRRKSAEDDPERATVTELEVGARTARLQVAYDGEIDEFATPLHYRVRPGDLRVLAP
jgi:diacylglycerol kinase family enzyme